MRAGRHCEERSSEAIQTRIALPVDCFPLCLRLAAGMTAAELVRVKDSIPRERASHGGLEVPAYELRLAVGSGLFEDVLGVGACGCAGNPKPEGGNAKAFTRNDFNEKALFGWSEPEPNGEAPSGGVKTSGRINHEKRGRGSFGIKNCDSTVGRDRENVGNERLRAWARQLGGSPGLARGVCLPRGRAHERLQCEGSRVSRGREPPALATQARRRAHEGLGLGIGEEDTAILS